MAALELSSRRLMRAADSATSVENKLQAAYIGAGGDAEEGATARPWQTRSPDCRAALTVVGVVLVVFSSIRGADAAFRPTRHLARFREVYEQAARPPAGGKNTAVEDGVAPHGQQVVHVHFQSKEGPTFALPFVSSEAWRPDSRAVHEAPAQPEKLSWGRRWLANGLAVTAVSLTFLAMKDLLTLYKRYRRATKARVIESRNRRQRIFLMDRVSDVNRKLKRFSASLQELEREKKHLKEANLHGAGGNALAFELAQQASSPAQPTPSTTSEGLEKATRSEAQSASPDAFKEHRQILNSEGAAGEKTWHFQGSTGDLQSVPRPVNIRVGPMKIAIARMRLIRQIKDVLSELWHIREELHAAHGDTLLLYIESVIREAKQLLRRAEGRGRGRDQDADGDEEPETGVNPSAEEGEQEDDVDMDDLAPLPQAREDDWVYQNESHGEGLGYDSMREIVPGMRGFGNTKEPQPAAQVPDMQHPFFAHLEKPREASVDSRVRKMERVLEKRRDVDDDDDVAKGAHHLTGEESSNTVTRAYHVMRNNPGLKPAQVLALLKRTDAKEALSGEH
ncbi:hypothetical protein BESB_032780 [Besnoitia besnoiti]|uniref:Uncharacterized protein n=1 Tax=Besnoitia besnoiti TaxID=94643 RepID=A0A2A9M449_BESBE|nr:uncharacterized protein BESB_032780 [Besnoitia besnoiti]PFH31081.1 hypothetical protein BESB_032780 [Besnoitia besnoiti]